MSIRNAVKQLDQALGSPVSGLMGRYRDRRTDQALEAEGQAAWHAWEADRCARRERYPAFDLSAAPWCATLEALQRDGLAVLPGAADLGVLSRIRAEMEAHLDAGTCLSRISRDTTRIPGDLRPATDFLSEEETRRGQSYFRTLTNYASIQEALVQCPSVAQLALDERLIAISAAYLECPPALGTLNLRKSFVNDVAAFDTLHFHSDGNSVKFLKFFFYLNDVDERGGPFCYVRGSHRERFDGWRRKYRWTHEEIAAAYGEDRMVYLTGNVGDIIVADTTGFHRGTKVQSADRRMLTVDYAIHPEFGNAAQTAQLRRADYDALSERQKVAADLLHLVD